MQKVKSKRKITKKTSRPSLNGNGSSASKRLQVLKTYKLYINGKFERSESGRYIKVKDDNAKVIANICRASRKDFRNTVVAARKAQSGWQNRTAYNRGQILYRMAEMLESRRDQFINQLIDQGQTHATAAGEVGSSIERLVYYAGWCDKYQQIFSSVNPVASSYFNFSFPEPTGVVVSFAPAKYSLLGLVSAIAPALVGGNSVICFGSEDYHITTSTFAEILNDSDVPAGTVNLLTAKHSEVMKWVATHMDVNAIMYLDSSKELIKTLQENISSNVKRLITDSRKDWSADEAQNPYFILDTQEIKTTWHPVGN